MNEFKLTVIRATNGWLVTSLGDVRLIVTSDEDLAGVIAAALVSQRFKGATSKAAMDYTVSELDNMIDLATRPRNDYYSTAAQHQQNMAAAQQYSTTIGQQSATAQRHAALVAEQQYIAAAQNQSQWGLSVQQARNAIFGADK